MSEMSPLLRLLVGVLNKGAWGSAVLLALFIGLLAWQRYTPQGLALRPGDAGFFIVLGVMLALAIYLVIATRRELARPPEDPGNGQGS